MAGISMNPTERLMYEALQKYRHCRHASIDCECTKEARRALELVEIARDVNRGVPLRVEVTADNAA